MFILGQEVRYVFTDADGNFELNDVTVGQVKVAIDGRTPTNAPAGVFWPEMVMAVELRPGAIGFSCCHLSSLSNTTVNFDGRIDYVLVRGVGHPVAGLLGKTDILGEVPADRVDGPAYPIWPSDHAGLGAGFLVPGANGLR